MKPAHYLIAADIILVLISIKIIFKTGSIFKKAVLGYIFEDFVDSTEAFDNWEKKHDIYHKINILYAAVLLIGGCSFLIWIYLF